MSCASFSGISPSAEISISTYILEPNNRVWRRSIPFTPFTPMITSLMLSSVASSQEWSTILSIASLKISTDAFTISTQIATLAIGSRIGKPSLAPKIPINAPTEDIASERWCHASAISAPEFIFFAALLVYQNIHSFTTIETTAAISANVPGIAMLAPEVLLIMFSIPFIPIPIPVARSNPDKIIEDTHSIRSCPY